MSRAESVLRSVCFLQSSLVLSRTGLGLATRLLRIAARCVELWLRMLRHRVMIISYGYLARSSYNRHETDNCLPENESTADKNVIHRSHVQCFRKPMSLPCPFPYTDL